MKRTTIQNLDFDTLDRIAGGCRPVAQAPAGNPFKKLQQVMPTVSVMPADYADIRDLSLPTAEIQDVAELPAINDLLPADHDIFADVSSDLVATEADAEVKDDLADLLDTQGAGSDVLQDAPPIWCGTPAQMGAWDDADAGECASDVEDEPVADVAAEPGWSVAMPTIEPDVAPPEARDHRVQIMAADASDAIVRDHRGGGEASDAVQPVIRDQR
jgi:hypothetical protein